MYNVCVANEGKKRMAIFKDNFSFFFSQLYQFRLDYNCL